MICTGVEFVHVSNPTQSSFWDIIKCDEIVVTRDAVDGLDAYLVKSPEEILVWDE